MSNATMPPNDEPDESADGNEAAPGTPGTGEDVCPACQGTGISATSQPCPECGGSGKIVEGIGGG